MNLHNTEHDETRWVLVYTTNTLWEAEVVRGFLRSHGIDAVVMPQVDTSRALTIGGLALAKIYVPTAVFAEAERVLNTYRQQS
jgi:hypothetical protein